MSSKRIKELEELISNARTHYYNNTSVISDDVYDAYIDELTELDPKNLAVLNIGSDPVSEWEKYTHKVRMGSLNKAQTDEEYRDWHSKYIQSGHKAFATLKLDGLSVSLIYENGTLVTAATRGSGEVGENIFFNVCRMKNVPLRLNKKVDATIRGEIVMSKENHAKHFVEYSNPRNAASGISRRFTGDGATHLDVLVYQLVCDDLEFGTQEEQFKLLTDLGFKVPDYYMLDSADDVAKLKQSYHDSKRDEYFVELDGLVVHNNSLHEIESHGYRDDRPKASIAVKFASVAKEATIKEIIVQLGNSGRLTPVAVFDPKVNLMGAEIERASLHNFSNINDLGIDVGCKVLVCRSNDVIPFVKEVSVSTGTIFPMPTHCPGCGTPVEVSGEYVLCPNTDGCEGQAAGRVENWIKKLNILEWGTALIERLVASKKVSTIADLYKLTVDDLANIERMGEKSAKKCHKLLWEYTEIPLDILVGSLSIPSIGRSMLKLVVEAGFDTLDKLNAASVEDFKNIKGFGPARAELLVAGLKKNHDMIKELLSLGIKIKEKTVGKLTGKSFCFTGAMTNKRAALEGIVGENGGTAKSSVGKDLSYLVINDLESTSSKAQSARKFGTKLISEQDFLDLVK